MPQVVRLAGFYSIYCVVINVLAGFYSIYFVVMNVFFYILFQIFPPSINFFEVGHISNINGYNIGVTWAKYQHQQQIKMASIFKKLQKNTFLKYGAPLMVTLTVFIYLHIHTCTRGKYKSSLIVADFSYVTVPENEDAGHNIFYVK